MYIKHFAHSCHMYVIQIYYYFKIVFTITPAITAAAVAATSIITTTNTLLKYAFN